MPRDPHASPQALEPVHIHGLITPVEGADGGVNHNMIHGHERGLLVILKAWLNMQSGDWVEVFWGNDNLPVAADTVLPEQAGKDFSIFIAASVIPEGIHDLSARITRAGGDNEETTPTLAILVRTVFPGGTDPDPEAPNHQNLLPAEPELPPNGIIDEEAAKSGIKVVIPGYPNMRLRDRITFSWGGELLYHEVTQADMDAGSVQLLVTEAVILEAGDSDELALVYRVRDEVHNPSSHWSMHTSVIVEVGKDRLPAPLIENPDPNADPYDVIDLDALGDDDLNVSVLVADGSALRVGDLVAPKWVGATAQGLPVEFSPAPQSVPRIPVVMTFLIPNASLRDLGGGSAVASYSVSRDGSPFGVSKRRFASFTGVEQSLPKPSVEHAVDGVLDPTLEGTTVIVPGEVLEAGDYVYMTWLGTRANGSTLVEEDDFPVSGGTAGKPMRFSIAGEFIAPLDGGTVEVYYRLYKRSIGLELESARERLSVGEAVADLPAPFTRPPAVDGVLDPESLTGALEIVVPPWPGMNDQQTVHLLWKASSGPEHDDYMPISPPLVGQEVPFHMDKATFEAYLGADVELAYRIEAPGEPTQVSAVLGFRVGAGDGIGAGPMQPMGARFNSGIPRGSSAPQMLYVLGKVSLQPMLAEWRYAGDEQWTASRGWMDEKPWLKLHVRNRDETWEYQPANIVGTGATPPGQGNGAFVAMRDEIMGASGPEVDMVAWGNPEFGGALDDRLASLKNVVEIHATEYACTARLRDGDLVCWGNPAYGGSPETIKGPFVQVASARWAFIGRRADGELHAWGAEEAGGPIPDDVLQHRDAVELCGATKALAVRRASGHVMAWGAEEYGGQLKPGQEDHTDIVQLISNQGAFAALRASNGARRVIAWGQSLYGGTVPFTIGWLSNVRSLAAATARAFCILQDNGMVKVWPPLFEEGWLPDAIARLNTVVEVSSTQHAFCVRLSDGSVRVWGHPDRGGTLTDEVVDRSDIFQVTGNERAFAALCADGSVVAWGDEQCGGDTRAVAGQLVDVRAIYGNSHAFTALTGDGRVVTWGEGASGGDSSKVQHLLDGKVTHSRRLSATGADGPVTVER